MSVFPHGENSVLWGRPDAMWSFLSENSALIMSFVTGVPA